MGFEELQIQEDAYVSFRFCGEVYETARMEGRGEPEDTLSISPSTAGTAIAF